MSRHVSAARLYDVFNKGPGQNVNANWDSLNPLAKRQWEDVAAAAEAQYEAAIPADARLRAKADADREEAVMRGDVLPPKASTDSRYPLNESRDGRDGRGRDGLGRDGYPASNDPRDAYPPRTGAPDPRDVPNGSDAMADARSRASREGASTDPSTPSSKAAELDRDRAGERPGHTKKV